MEVNNTDKEKSILEKYNISPVLFGFISLIVIFISYQMIGSFLTYLIIGGSFEGLSPNFIRIISTIGQILFLLLPTLLLARLLPDNFKKIFKLNKISFALCIWIIISVFALMQICEVILLLQSQIPLPESIKIVLDEIKIAIEETYKRLVYSDSISELGLVIMAVAIVPSICEELLFRGLIQHAFTSELRAKNGIIITGLFFAFFHLNPLSFIAVAILGIYLSFLAYKTNSIISAMLGHFTNNVIAVIVPYFLGRDDLIIDSTNAVLTTNEFISLFFIFLVALPLFILSLFMIFKKTAVVSPMEG